MFAALGRPASAREPSAPTGAAHIAICDDGNEWPPYVYYQRADGKPSSKLVGYAIDVIEEIFAARHIAHHITLLPWARCLAEVSSGKRYQMVLGMARTAARERTYFLTQPYYSIRTFYFYSRLNHPNGLNIQSEADLYKHRVCSILDYDLSGMGFKPEQVDQGAASYDAVIRKLHVGRCALFISQFEPMLGYAMLGRRYLDDPNLGYAAIPNFRLASFVMAVSRASVNGEALRDSLNDELRAMKASRRLDALWRKYQSVVPADRK